MLTLKINATGRTTDDLALAVEEALRRVRDDFTSGFDRNEHSSFDFTVDGDEEPPADD